jgi:hypothetical protein
MRSGYFMYHQIYIPNFCIMFVQFISVICMDLTPEQI